MKYSLREKLSIDAGEVLTAYPNLLRELLINRGIRDSDAAELFLRPDFRESVYGPFLLVGMKKAVSRILKALNNGEKIVIFSDYDTDGIPGAVILHDFFHSVGYKNFSNYIPHRNKEGFGLSISAVEKIAREGGSLIITIDCGIANVDEVICASRLGVDVIVTDHHLPNGELPRAHAIVNPNQEGDTYPNKHLCGAGVAYKLIQALIEKGGFNLSEGFEEWILDMVGIATISDMVPLVDENRTLARFGLSALRKSSRPGIVRLLRKAGVKQQHLSEDDVAFTIAPRINAASRMDVPEKAFKLLSTKSVREAETLVDYLNAINEERKGAVAAMMKEIIKKTGEKNISEPVLVVGNTSWKPGLLGLAATAAVRSYDRPVFLWGREESSDIKGSCRTDGSVNLVDLMGEVKELFIAYGGHRNSGGFSISGENIHYLGKKLNEAYKLVGNSEHAREPLLIDKKLGLEDVNWETYSLIEQLSPFGIENPKPLFLFERVELASVRSFGKSKNHLELKLKNGTSAIGFFKSADDFDVHLEPGRKINLVAVLEKSVFRNFPELRLRIVDVI